MKYFIIVICIFLLSGCNQDSQIQEDIKQINQNTQIPIWNNCSGTLSIQAKNELLDWTLNDRFTIKEKKIDHRISTNLYDHTIEQKISLTGKIIQQISGNGIYHDFDLHNPLENKRANNIIEILNQTHPNIQVTKLENITQIIRSLQNKPRNTEDQNLQIDNIILIRNPEKKFYTMTGDYNIIMNKKKLEIYTNGNPSRQRTQHHKSDKINIDFHNQIDRQRQLLIQTTITKKQEQYRNIVATLKVPTPKGDLFRRHDDILGNIHAEMLCIPDLEKS